MQSGAREGAIRLRAASPAVAGCSDNRAMERWRLHCSEAVVLCQGCVS